MASGTTKQIKDIVPGDVVMSYDTATGKLYPNVVLKTINFTVHGEYIINNKVRTDGGEVFYTHDGWVFASQLKVGDEILNPTTGAWIPVSSVSYENIYIKVYDIVCASGNSFMVDGGYLADILSV